MFRPIQCLTLLLMFGYGMMALGQPLGPSAEQRRSAWEDRMIRGNIAVSEWFDGIAEGLDLFLARKKLTNRRNETSVRLQNSTYVVDREGVTNSTGAGVSLSLPNLEEYWNLKFTTYDERREKRGLREGQLRQTPRQRNVGATVGLFRKLGDVRTSFEPRIELQDPLKVSHSLTFDSTADMGKYIVDPELEFFATPDKGTGNFVAINFRYPISEVYSLSWINEGEYLDKLHAFSVSNGLSFGQSLNERMGLSYSFFVGSNSKPSYRMTGYSFSVAWGHLLYRRVLDYQIVPQLNFSEAHGYAGRPSLTFNIGMTF